MLQHDHQEAQVLAMRDSLRRAYVDSDATDQIDRAVSAAMGDEPDDDMGDEDDEC